MNYGQDALIEALQAERDALKDSAADTIALLRQLEADNKRLRAELARHEEAPTSTMIRWSTMKSQLAELCAVVAEHVKENHASSGSYPDCDTDGLEAVLNKVKP